MNPLIVLYALVPIAAAGISGAIAAVRRPSERVESGIQHFAAGVIVAAAAIELLPDLLRHSPTPTLIGFALGLLIMFGLRWWSERLEKQPGRGATGLMLATGVDFLVDGLVMGAGFAAGGHTGPLLTLAVTVEYLFVGISVATALGAEATRVRRVATPVALSLLTLIGTLVGARLLAEAPEVVLVVALAFGAVAFMYLVTEELLVRAHERGETALGSVFFFVGFLLFLVIEELNS